jgi:glycine/D-amino acid oxidase-like deaminating enzyme
MTTLLVVGGGLFGSLAAAWARQKGIEAMVFDPGLPGAASPAAAGLFCEAWAGKKRLHHYRAALPLLEQLYEIRSISLSHDDGTSEQVLCLPPATIMEKDPIRAAVTRVGDGFLEAGGKRYDGWVYVAAGVWCEQFLPGVGVYGRSGASFLFRGERPGRTRMLQRGKRLLAFTRDPGTTFFSDGTAERVYTEEHDRQTLARAEQLGLVEPVVRRWGQRPYTPGGPVFHKMGNRTWLATGGQKTGVIIGAAFARRLVEEELR